MTRHAFDEKLAALEALRSASDSASTRGQLRIALQDRNNYLTSRAAAIAAELKFEELVPDLLAAFDRFFIDPVKSDPKCLAKNAIAKALKDLGHRGAPAYLRGIGHFQLEPAWGGPADSAATLRGTCALALTNCLMDEIEILTYLADGLADPETRVRIDCVIAIDQLGTLRVLWVLWDVHRPIRRASSIRTTAAVYLRSVELDPCRYSTTRMMATSQSTAAQKRGHHRVFAT